MGKSDRAASPYAVYLDDDRAWPTGLLPTNFGHADELIEQGLHCARVELRRHHAPVRSLRRAA